MGQPKLLLPWRGVQLIRHVVQTALQSQLDELVVVVGHRAAHVTSALDGLAARIVHNPHFVDGQSTSLRAGLAAASNAEAIVVLLADQPLLKSTTIDAIVERYKHDHPLIVVPRYQGQRGNPVLFDRSVFPKLQELTGDQGARGVLHEYSAQIAWLDVEDAGVLLDVDTPTGYAQLLEHTDTNDRQ